MKKVKVLLSLFEKPVEVLESELKQLKSSGLLVKILDEVKLGRTQPAHDEIKPDKGLDTTKDSS